MKTFKDVKEHYISGDFKKILEQFYKAKKAIEVKSNLQNEKMCPKGKTVNTP